MATGGISAIGTLLQCNAVSGSATYITIAEVGDIDGPQMKTTMVDATNHSSSGSGAFTEGVPTVHTMGQLKFPVNFIPTNTTHNYAAGVMKLWANRTMASWKLIFPDSGSTNWTFNAYVTGVNIKGQVKGILTADIVLDITGVPTLA